VVSLPNPVEGLALFGFVFLGPEKDFIFIILCDIKGYVHFAVAEIGFVLQKIGRFVEHSRQL